VREIPLTKGKVALVDDWHYQYLMQWKWCSSPGYAERRISRAGRCSNCYMHRVVAERMGLGVSEGQIDHIDGNKLNNQESNLRIATGRQNHANVPRYCNNKSGFKGVHWNRAAKKWQAQIRANEVRHHLGYFSDKIDAAEAYNKAAVKYFGEFARLNNLEDEPCVVC
jgi:hypothetical protein